MRACSLQRLAPVARGQITLQNQGKGAGTPWEALPKAQPRAPQVKRPAHLAGAAWKLCRQDDSLPARPSFGTPGAAGGRGRLASARKELPPPQARDAWLPVTPTAASDQQPPNACGAESPESVTPAPVSFLPQDPLSSVGTSPPQASSRQRLAQTHSQMAWVISAEIWFWMGTGLCGRRPLGATRGPGRGQPASSASVPPCLVTTLAWSPVQTRQATGSAPVNHCPDTPGAARTRQVPGHSPRGLPPLPWLPHPHLSPRSWPQPTSSGRSKDSGPWMASHHRGRIHLCRTSGRVTARQPRQQILLAPTPSAPRGPPDWGSHQPGRAAGSKPYPITCSQDRLTRRPAPLPFPAQVANSHAPQNQVSSGPNKARLSPAA